MAKETLGAHLRNLMTPYKNVIKILNLSPNVNTYVKELEKNFNEMLEFSKSEKMESINWREE